MKLKHPSTGQTVETDASRAPMYESQGWQPAPPSPKTAPAKPRKRAAKKAAPRKGK